MSDCKDNPSALGFFPESVVKVWQYVQDEVESGLALYFPSIAVRQESQKTLSCSVDGYEADDEAELQPLVAYGVNRPSFKSELRIEDWFGLPVSLSLSGSALSRLGDMARDAWYIEMRATRVDDEPLSIYEISHASMRMQSLKLSMQVLERDESITQEELKDLWGEHGMGVELSFIWHYRSRDGVWKEKPFEFSLSADPSFPLGPNSVFELRLDYSLYDYYFEIWDARCLINS